MDTKRPIGTSCLRDLTEPPGDLTRRLRHTASSRSLDKLDHPPSGRGAVGRAGDGLLGRSKRSIRDAEAVVEERSCPCDDRQADPLAALGCVRRSDVEHCDGVMLTPAKRREGYGAPRRETCFRRLDDDMRLVDQRFRGVELALEEMDIDARVEGEGKLAQRAAAAREVYVKARQHVPARVIPYDGRGDRDQPQQMQLVR